MAGPDGRLNVFGEDLKGGFRTRWRPGCCDFIHSKPLSEPSGFLPSSSLLGNHGHTFPLHFCGTLQVGFWKTDRSTEGKDDENGFSLCLCHSAWSTLLRRVVYNLVVWTRTFFELLGVGLGYSATRHFWSIRPILRRPFLKTQWRAEWRGNVIKTMLCYQTAPGVETGPAGPAGVS